MKGSRVVAALERTWETIQTHHPDVPDVTLSVGFVKRMWGFAQGNHVVISWAALNAGPETVVGTLLHEAVHCQLKALQRTDWHRHTRPFRRCAESFGLEVDPHPYGPTEMLPATRTRYSECLNLIAQAVNHPHPDPSRISSPDESQPSEAA